MHSSKIYKAGGLQIAEKLTELFQWMWMKEAIQQEFNDAFIIHLVYKRKGNTQVCDNHRGSSLSFAGIQLNHLSVHLDPAEILQESQCGFMKDSGTIDMIFTARQFRKKCHEQNVDLYMNFVDLNKAFNTVGRDGI